MSLEIRELQSDELFLLLSIFNKLDIIDELSDIYTGKAAKTDEKSKKDIAQVGLEVTAILAKKALSNIALIQVDLNQLLSNLTGKTLDEIRQVKMIDYVTAVTAIFRDPQFKDFFSSIPL